MSASLFEALPEELLGEILTSSKDVSSMVLLGMTCQALKSAVSQHLSRLRLALAPTFRPFPSLLNFKLNCDPDDDPSLIGSPAFFSAASSSGNLDMIRLYSKSIPLWLIDHSILPSAASSGSIEIMIYFHNLGVDISLYYGALTRAIGRPRAIFDLMKRISSAPSTSLSSAAFPTRVAQALSYIDVLINGDPELFQLFKLNRPDFESLQTILAEPEKLEDELFERAPANCRPLIEMANPRPRALLLRLARAGRIDLLQTVLSEFPSIVLTSEVAFGMAQFSSEMGHLDFLRFISAQVDWPKDGGKILYSAMRGHHIEIMEYIHDIHQVPLTQELVPQLILEEPPLSEFARLWSLQAPFRTMIKFGVYLTSLVLLDLT